MKPQAPEYTLRSTAKYLNALDTLYENLELELKISNSKLKEAEAETQVIRKVGGQDTQEDLPR